MTLYDPPGASATQLGDIDVITHDGAIHLFHLVLPNHDLVAHAISTDGLTWTQQPPALRTGDPGDCDDDMIWTMHVVKHPQTGRFNMYYTGCSTAESGNHQRVALAFSDDLTHWTKHDGNPILESRGPHYNDNFDLVGMISFRDPFVFIDDGVWHMLVTGRVAQGPRFFRGSIVHATSPDGVEWALQPPLYAPGQFEDMEVAAMLKLGGRYYLSFHDFAGCTHYRIADSLDGPWRAPQRDMLLPAGNNVHRFCDWNGRKLLYHWLRAECDWKRRSPSAGVCSLAPPKEVDIADNGEMILRSFSGWTNLHDGAAESLPDHAAEVDGHHRADLCGDHGDFILEGDFRLNRGRRLGVIFRADRGLETAVWLRVDFADQTIDLWKHTPFDSNLNRWKIRKQVVQSAHANLEHGRTYRMRLLCSGPYIEFCLGGVVYLSAATYRAQRGAIAPFIEDGAGALSNLTIQPLKSLS